MKCSEDIKERAYRYHITRLRIGLVGIVLLGLVTIVCTILLIINKIDYFMFYLLCAAFLFISIFGFIYCYKQLKEASYLEE